MIEYAKKHPLTAMFKILKRLFGKRAEPPGDGFPFYEFLDRKTYLRLMMTKF